MQTKQKIMTRTHVAMGIVLVVIPLLILYEVFYGNREHTSLVAAAILILSMLPFCISFEHRKPQARELILIAVMSAIAVVGRIAFFMIPQFKPISAIVILAGIGLGAEAGFLTGAVAGFVSNFFFGQGPWTPWQMFAFGMMGYLAGLLFHKRKQFCMEHTLVLCLYGGLATIFVFGLLMDTSSVLMMGMGFEKKAILGVYLSGIPFNIIHGISTIVFLFVLTGPMLKKLDRIQRKYGILE